MNTSIDKNGSVRMSSDAYDTLRPALKELIDQYGTNSILVELIAEENEKIETYENSQLTEVKQWHDAACKRVSLLTHALDENIYE